MRINLEKKSESFSSCQPLLILLQAFLGGWFHQKVVMNKSWGSKAWKKNWNEDSNMYRWTDSVQDLTSFCLLYILTGLWSPRRLCSFVLPDSLGSPGLIRLNSWLYRFALKLQSCHPRRSQEVCCRFFSRGVDVGRDLACGLLAFSLATPADLWFSICYPAVNEEKVDSIPSPEICGFFPPPERAAISALRFAKKRWISASYLAAKSGNSLG